MFCVECGKATDGAKLCRECAMNKREPVSVPPLLSLPICAKCGSFVVGGKWKETSPEDAIWHLVESKLSPQGGKMDLRLEQADGRNWNAGVTVTRRIEGAECRDEAKTRVSLSNRVCDRCSRQSGSYFEAILQVRADRRDPTQAELDGAADLVDRKAFDLREKGVFITRLEEVRGGIDIYLSSKEFARQMAKNIAESTGGTTSASPQLFGQKDGKEVYRVTHVVKFAAYWPGCFLLHRGRIYQLRTMGRKSLGVKALDTWEEISLPAKEIIEAKVLGGDELVREAVIVSEGGRELQILDPATNKTVDILKPQGWVRTGETTLLLKYEEQYYLV
ncbi:MAG: hypothetical protein HZB92_00905 [Euryarchaeota archaeon]|nr:hypothetical protein [Euryarchaeota archaeon]